MKKFFSVISMVAALAACSKEGIKDNVTATEPGQIKFEISVDDPAVETKATKTAWESGDQIDLWLNGNYGQEPDLILTFDGTKWTCGTLKEGVIPEDGGKIVALYEGGNCLGRSSFDLEYTYDGTTDSYGLFRFISEKLNKKFCRLSAMVIGCSGLTYSFTENTIKANLTGWTYLTSVHIALTDNDESHIGAVMTCPGLHMLRSFTVKPDGSIDTRSDSEIPCSGSNAVLAGKGSSNVFDFYLVDTHNNGTLGDYDFTFEFYTYKNSQLNLVDTYTYPLRGKVLTLDDTHCTTINLNVDKMVGRGKAAVSSSYSSPGRTDCTWVQLWKNGPKWAEFNVGSTISNYSNLAAGTDTVPYSLEGYNTANVGGLYAYCVGTKNARLDYSTYCDDAVESNYSNYNVEMLTEDIVTLFWGSLWKSPTPSDIHELVLHCDWTWCDGSTVKYCGGCTLAGYKVSGKGIYQYNSIFLPAAGYILHGKGQVCGKMRYPGEVGRYYTSTLYDNNSLYVLYARYALSFAEKAIVDEQENLIDFNDYNLWWYGTSLRAVLK